jgi:hypothetical protein
MKSRRVPAWASGHGAWLVLAAGCSASPAAPAAPPLTLPSSSAAAAAPSLPRPSALWIEGEGLSPAIDLAFSPDHAGLFVQRRDGSVEAWDPVKGTLLGRASSAESGSDRPPGNPFSKPPEAPSTPGAPGPLVLTPLTGVDDAKLVAWLKTKGVHAETTARGLALTAEGDVAVRASPDGRIVVVTKDGAAEIAHRVAHTHFAVKGWNIGFSSHYGYAGDNTTWPGDVSASFGPLPDQLALQSVAQRSLYYAFGATRLYDPRQGKLTAELPDETCQPNDLVWSPLGKYLVRAECQGAMLLFTDAATGKSIPSLPGGMPVRFGADDATVASVFGGGVAVRRLGDSKASVVVPGPGGPFSVALAPGGENLGILSFTGLDVWDLVAGKATHVDATVARNPDLARSATGRFHGFFDDGSPGGLTIFDTTTAVRGLFAGSTAFHPTRDRVARADAAGIRVEDLVTGEVLGPPVALPEGKSKSKPRIGVQQLSFSPDGAWLVAQLLDASLLVIDGQGHLAQRVPPLDPDGCAPGPMQFAAPDTVSLSCANAVHTVSLTSGKALPRPLWTDTIEQGRARRPAFSPPIVEAALNALPPSYGSVPWSATPSLLVARLDPPLLVRAKDGRFVSLHSFAHGVGHAAIVVDDRGRWDADALGESLVRVSVGGAEDAEEKARRRVPGLLAAFVRGE